MIKKRKKAIHRNEVGRRYGRLVVVSREPDGHSRRGEKRWLCKCDCGTMTVVYQGNLRRGQSKSCGCLLKEIAKHKHLTHGESNYRSNKGTKEYTAWARMLQRCYNNKLSIYKNYGGRGIKVCQRWLNSYINFLSDVGRASGQKYTLGRINNDGNYEPSNVRWETLIQQASNKRTSRFITIGSTTHTLAEWSRISGKQHQTISYRLKVGRKPKDAVFQKTRAEIKSMWCAEQTASIV